MDAMLRLIDLRLTACIVLFVSAPPAFAAQFSAPGMFTPPAGAAAPRTMSPVVLPPADKNAPVTLNADEMAYDQKSDIVIARGKVEVSKGASILNADQITYFKQRNLVVAEGNVSMLQASGEIYFAERAELKDDMKSGVIKLFMARLADDSLMVADSAVKVSPSVTQLHKVSYTPCQVCEDMAPFWQINAGDVQVDEGAERVSYDGATMDIYGLPILYTPYLSHPTPDAQAKSGFMMPEYSSSSTLGTIYSVPYYWRMGHDRDMLITGWYTTEQGALLQEDYHQLTDHGTYRVRTSGTYPNRINAAGSEISGNEFRGHIYATGDEAISDTTHVGFDINRATDDTYLRRYGFGDQRTLFSTAYAVAAQDRNYALIRGVSIQGLRATDNPRTTPLVLPTLQGYYETRPDEHGLKYHVSGDAQSLSRRTGVDQQRLSSTVGATLPYLTDNGQMLTSTVNVRQDLYHSINVPITGTSSQFDGTTTRTLPQAALEWRYPLIRSFGDESMVIEPIALGVLQTENGNTQKISNEDDTLIELTDTNLFSLDRMPGLDLVDSGSRTAYGFRSQYLFRDGTAFDALLGQNYAFSNDTPFPNSTRQGENFSDYIGRVAITYMPISLIYRFALDNKDYTANRNEATLGFSKPWLTIGLSYRSVTNNRYVGKSEEAVGAVSLPLGDQWSLHGSTVRDMDIDQYVSASYGLIYKNDCFNLMIDGAKSFARDRDVAPDAIYTVRVGFKNLGEFGDK